MEKVDVLRLEVLKRFQTEDISALKKDVFRKGFYENMENFYNQAKEDYIKVPSKKQTDFKAKLKTCFASNSFKKIFDKFNLEGYSLDSTIESLISSEKSISKFLKNQKTNSITHDFFSVFLGYKGFNDFVLNHKISNPIKDDKKEINLDKSLEVKLDYRLQVIGAKIIDSEFIEKVKKVEEFTQLQFYSANQVRDCQWYGVIHDFDVEREIYNQLKTCLKNCFNHETDLKVNAILSGSGGSGKSTLLRRLAIDLSNESFKVVWVEDNGIDKFIEHGLFEIEQKSSTNFLIIIEDWYRTIEGKDNVIKLLFEKINKIKNVRVVIGDRENIKSKAYYKHLNSKDNLYSLSSVENEQIIKNIILKYPKWDNVAEIFFKKSANYNSSLFLLLFIIARLNKKNETRVPETIFIDLIKSDLKRIGNSNIGLAKALYYWACVYKMKRIFISYKSFLIIADYYNKDNSASTHFIRWNLDNPTLRILKNYINIDEKSTSLSDCLILFNHDTLADFGLSEVSFNDWEEFNDITRFELLEILVEKADHKSVSVYLSSMLMHKPDIFMDKSDKLKYINSLLQNNNNHYSYLNQLASLRLTNEEFEFYAQALLEKRFYPSGFWIYFLKAYKIKTLRNKFKHQVLIIENWKEVPHEVLTKALMNVKIEIKQVFYLKVLTDFYNAIFNNVEKDYTSFSFHIICPSLSHPDNTKIKNELANLIIKNQSWKILSQFIIQTLIDSVDKLESEVLCNVIIDAYLDAENIIEIDFDFNILRASLNKTSNLKLKIEAANRILLDKKVGKEHKMLLSDCLSYADSGKIKNFAKRFLDELLDNKIERDLFFPYNTSLTTILNMLDSGLKLVYVKKLSNKISEDDSIKYNFTYEILKLADNQYKTYFVNQILEEDNWRKYDQQLVCDILNDCSKDFQISFSNKVLESANLEESQYSLVFSKTIEITKNKSVALHFLKEWDKYNWFVINSCLKCFESEDSIPVIVSEIIFSIIDNYKKEISYNNYQKRRGIRFPFKSKYDKMYSDILNICFESDRDWHMECLNIMKNWNKLPRNFISNILESYRENPNQTKSVCTAILENWREEFINYGDAVYYNYTKLALQHPYLRELALKTALEMKKRDDKSKFLPPNYRSIIDELTQND